MPSFSTLGQGYNTENITVQCIELPTDVWQDESKFYEYWLTCLHFDITIGGQ